VFSQGSAAVAWIWVLESIVLNLHAAQLAEHGGGEGVRDEGLLSSALARPQNLLVYGDTPDAATLAGAYAFGIARNHPFVDGNKRTAFVTLELFLDLNGWTLTADDASCIATMEALAAGTLSEADLAAWVRSCVMRL
jgi:death-on-curing protein